ncbi:MAG: nitrogenase component 1 [Methanomicrobiales archaeon]|nr:nitrogenase component 1 [Methanomicrobiales archaeon]MDI6876393.1 nitrogenase component 1 [Methanomicrobiales archaeon]
MQPKAVRIPRGTCSLFGTIRAVGGIRNSSILVHGPKGCVYHINYILGMRGGRPSRIYSTCLDEQDVIFGAERKLRDAIDDLLEEQDPDILFVLSCCASSIIGEDVGSAVADSSSRGRVIGLESGGFEGDFRTGYSRTLCTLVRELAGEPRTVDPRSVNLIGLLRGGPDLQELRRMLSRRGISVNTVLTAGADLPSLERMGDAALNIVLCEAAGKEAAELLCRRFHTPYLLETLPIGAGASCRFLQRVAEALSLAADADGCEELQPFDPACLQGRKIAIIGGPTRALSVTRFLVELGVEPRLVVLDFDTDTRGKISDMLGTACDVLVEPEQDLIFRNLKEKGIDLVLGGLLERPLADALSIEHLDIMHGCQSTVGFRGAENLQRLLLAGRND